MLILQIQEFVRTQINSTRDSMQSREAPYTVRDRVEKRAWVFLSLLSLQAVVTLRMGGTPAAQSHADVRAGELLCVLAAGVVGLAYALWPERGASAPILGSLPSWLVVLLPGYVLFQILPLPLWALRILSPQRAAIEEALAPVGLKSSWAPLSVTPAATLFHFLLLAACAVVFLVVYRLAWRFSARPWLLVLPLLVLAALEAVLGLFQASGNPDRVAQGTFDIRNHFAGFLEMLLPFAALYPFTLRPDRSRPWRRLNATLPACLSVLAALLILAGIIASLSRGGFFSCLGSMTFVAMAALIPGRSRLRQVLLLSAVVSVAFLVFVLLPPTQLIQRFGETERSTFGRTMVWRDSLHLIAAYPLFGCGFGAYEAAFTKFKTSSAEFDQDYAHNDWLQYLAELGILGFGMGAAFLGIILARLRTAWSHPRREIRWLALACAGAAAAIGLHSAADFNLYVPANMMVFAWILGLAAYAGLAGAASTLPAPDSRHRSKLYP